MGEDDFYGAVSTFAGTYAPINYALCQGQTFQVQQYAALYALIGPYFEQSDNTNTFLLPNLSTGVPIGVGQSATSITQLGSTGQTAHLVMSGGAAGAVTSGGVPTEPVMTATPTLGLNYVLCVNGIWPSRP